MYIQKVLADDPVLITIKTEDVCWDDETPVIAKDEQNTYFLQYFHRNKTFMWINVEILSTPCGLSNNTFTIVCEAIECAQKLGYTVYVINLKP